MEKDVNRSDIIENIRNHNYARKKHFINTEYDVKVARKIISLYIYFMTEALFRGKNWTLPQRLGKIKIVRNTYKAPENMPFFNGHLKGQEIHNKRVFNPKTPGLVFKIEITSPYLQKHKCRFRASKTIRKRLFNELYNGELSNIIK